MTVNLVIMKLIKYTFLSIIFILVAFGALSLYHTFNNNTNSIKIDTIKITIPEGFTNDQIGLTLEKSGLVSKKDFLNEIENWTNDDYWFLQSVPNDKHKLDGFLFPATYYFPKNATSKAIITKMLNTFKTNVEPYKDYIINNKLNIRNVVTIASLVEKEAAKDIDRPKIASVIYNRLDKNMPLQIDAAILYVIGHKDKLYNKDLKIKSPYNTYLNKGLTPSPICCPGIKSINAAVYPAKTDYLYYVLNTKTNVHVFSKTYAEQIKNIALYMK